MVRSLLNLRPRTDVRTRSAYIACEPGPDLTNSTSSWSSGPVRTQYRSRAAVAEGELLLLVSNLLRNDCVFARVYVLQRDEFDRLADNKMMNGAHP